jgi:hypothetical protein
MAARSTANVCGCSLAEIAGSNAAGDTDVCRECCGLSGSGLCEGPISRPEGSYRACACVCVCVCV